jgi:curved DNA-binding protein
MSHRHLYDILGVPPDASMSDISVAYRNLAKLYHPDKSNGNVEKFKELANAYTILTDTTKRNAYDATGNGNQCLSRPPTMCVNTKISPDNSTFNGLFENFFGSKDLDIHQNIVISLAEFFTGGSKPLTYIQNQKEVSITIVFKAGMKLLKYPQQGHSTTTSKGDLIIHFEIHNKTPFQIVNNDLKLVQKITLIEALNGVKRPVHFPDGSVFLVTTEPLTNRTSFVYKGYGLPICDEMGPKGPTDHGDLIVTFEIILPASLPVETKQKLIETIAPFYTKTKIT